MPSHTLSISLPEEIYQSVTELAEEEDRSKGWVIKKAIKEYAEKQKKES